MSITLRKVKNPNARPIMFASGRRCQHWRGCQSRAIFMVPQFMGQIAVCPRHADGS